MTNFCGACGKALNAETQFCTSCGAAITPVPARDPQSTATDVPRASAFHFSGEIGVQAKDKPRRTWPLVVLGAAAAVMIGWIYVSPYLALRSLKQAALDGNIDALKESVDFPALRTSLKEELGGLIARKAVKEIRQDNTGFGVLGSALAGGVVNAMIEELVTPQVLAEFVQGKSFDGTPLALYGERFSPKPRTVGGGNVPTISIGYKSFGRFDVRVFPPQSKAAVTLVLLRSGLTNWRLSGICLPADMDELAKEPNDAINSTLPHEHDERASVVIRPNTDPDSEVETKMDELTRGKVSTRFTQTGDGAEVVTPSSPPEPKPAENGPLRLNNSESAATPDIGSQHNSLPNWGDPLSKTMNRPNGSSGGGVGNDGGVGGVFKVGGGVSAPEVLFKVEAEYSEEAHKAKYSGTVLLSLIVDSEGHARDIHVVKSMGMGLDEKAIEAVQKWKFKPGMKGGLAVNVRAQIEVNFRLL